MPYFVVVLAGRQARLRPSPRLVQLLLETLSNPSIKYSYQSDQSCFGGGAVMDKKVCMDELPREGYEKGGVTLRHLLTLRGEAGQML